MSLSRRDVLLGALAGILPLPGHAACAADRHLALIIGVSDYQDNDNDLAGPRHDAVAFEQLLTEQYGFAPERVRVLLDAQATTAGVRSGLDWATKNAGPSDTVLFFFSGRGTTIPGSGGDPEGAFVPYNAAAAADCISATELTRWVEQLPTEQVLVIMDASDSPGQFRMTTVQNKGTSSAKVKGAVRRPASTDKNSLAFLKTKSGGLPPRGIYIAAAAPGQPAFTLAPSAGVPPQSAMSALLLSELRAAGGELTYAEALSRVEAKMRQTFGSAAPIPQMSGTLTSAKFLAAAQRPGIASGIAARVETIAKPVVTLRAISGATLEPGALLAVVLGAGRKTRMVDTGNANKTPGVKPPPALVRVGSVRQDTATGTLVRGVVNAGDVLSVVLRPLSPTRLKVDTTKLARPIDLETALKPLGFDINGTSGADITLLPDETDASRVVPFKGTLPLPSIPAADVPALMRRLEAGKQLAELTNPSPALKASLTANGQPGSIEARPGEKVDYEMVTDRDAYLTIIAISSDGSITGPPSGHKVSANSPFRLRGVTITEPVGLDIVKVFATTFPVTVPVPGNAEQAARLGNDSATIARTLLEALRVEVNRHAAQTKSRGQDFTAAIAESAVPVMATEGWAAAEVLVRVVR